LDDARGFSNVDLGTVIDQWKQAQALKPKDAANLQVEPREVVLADGSKINFGAVWTGTQWQILRAPDEAGDTAEMKNVRAAEDNFERAQNLYRDGNRRGALNILRAMKVELYRGSAITDADLDTYFGPPDEEQARPAPVTNNLFDEADRIIRNR
jgi:hypothetical protein